MQLISYFRWQFVEHHPNHEKAKEWMEKNLSEEIQRLYLGEPGNMEKRTL